MNKIPLLDLKAQYKSIKDELEKEILETASSAKYIMGERVKNFEEKIRKYTGAKYAIGCASGSDALLLSLMAIGIKEGDEVITTPYTFFATAGAVSRIGAIPVFVDIKEKDCNIDVEKIEEKITKKTKAIIPVHLYGKCADMQKLLEIAKKYDLRVVEDACQAIGANYRFDDGVVRQAGTMGDTGCFSFFPSKNLGCMGDGGLITTNDPQLYEKISILRVHGSNPKYFHKVVGINSRLDSIQAGILSVKLDHLTDWTKRRIDRAGLYHDLFIEKGLQQKITWYGFFDYEKEHIYHQFVIQAEQRDELKRYLDENGIGNALYYPLPLHVQECFRDLGYKIGDMPISENKAQTTIALPVYPELEDEKIRLIVDLIRDFYI